MIDGGDGGGDRGERVLGEVLCGEGGTETGVLHAYFDGYGPAQCFGAAEEACEQIAEEEAGYVEEEYRDEKRCGCAGDLRFFQTDNAGNDQYDDDHTDEWADGVDPAVDGSGSWIFLQCGVDRDTGC